MSESRESQLEEQLRKTLGSPSPPDFESWRNRHGEAIAHLNPVVTTLVQRRRRFLMRIASTTAVAVLVVVAGFSIFTSQQQSFAQTIQTIDKAQTVTWTTTSYSEITSQDGKRIWMRSEGRKDFAFQAPNLYRRTEYDKEGQIEFVEIDDLESKKTLKLDWKSKKAIWKAESWLNRSIGSTPFDDVIKILKTYPLEFVGQREINGSTANVFRQHRGDIPNTYGKAYDFWIDAKTKQLVRITNPVLEVELERNNPVEKKWLRGQPGGSRTENIFFNAGLDPKLFDMTPPDGFVVEHERPIPAITEEELIEWLAVTARFNGGTYVDDDRGVDHATFNAAHQKKPADRTEVEQKFFDLWQQHYSNHNRSPISDFVKESAVRGSFRYLGKGVKLGAADRIVCWYKLKDAAKYRVVYGDLTIKEVAPEDLPLPVEK